MIGWKHEGETNGLAHKALIFFDKQQGLSQVSLKRIQFKHTGNSLFGTKGLDIVKVSQRIHRGL